MRQENKVIDWPKTRLTLLDRVRTFTKEAFDEFLPTTMKLLT